MLNNASAYIVLLQVLRRWISPLTLIFAITLITIFMSGCGRSKPVAQESEYATVEVTREVFVVVTSTPTPPTIPASPTPIVIVRDMAEGKTVSLPTSQPVEVELEEYPLGSKKSMRHVVIPDGWRKYKFIGKDTAFAYPPDWSKTDEDIGSVQLERGGYQEMYIFANDKSLISGVAEARRIELLKTLIVEGMESYDVTFHKEGVLDTIYETQFVTALFTDEYFSASMILSIVDGGDRQVLIILSNLGVGIISDADIDVVSNIANSIVFDPAKTIVDTESVKTSSSSSDLPGMENRTNVQQIVNLRSGPGTNYAVVGSLGPSDYFEIIGRNESSDWYQIETIAGQTAWVASFLVFGVSDVSSILVTQ